MWHHQLEALARELARSRTVERIVRILPADNEWAASWFLVKLLLHARPLRPKVDGERAQAILVEQGSSVKIKSLEDRGWVRFVLGRLKIPNAVRDELRTWKKPEHEKVDATAPKRPKETWHIVPKADQTELPTSERDALQLLEAALQDETAPMWVPKADVERIHGVHSLAHERTPSLEKLTKDGVLSPARVSEEDAFALPLGPPNTIWERHAGRVFGLYWEDLIRDSRKNKDEESFKRWLDVAIETPAATSAPQYLLKDDRERLLDAAQKHVLGEPDIADPEKEIQRLRGEADGRGFYGAPPTLRPLLPKEDDLLKLYEWWRESYFGSVGRLRHCRDELDPLIGMVTHYDDHPQANRVVQLLEESKTRPYLMYYVTLGLIVGRPDQIAGLMIRPSTVALGMQLIVEIEARGEPSHTDLRRHAVELLLASATAAPLDAPPSPDQERLARSFAGILIISARALHDTTRSNAVASYAARQRKGAADRHNLLLDALEKADKNVFAELAHSIHSSVLQDFEQSPNRIGGHLDVPKLTILFWLLRVALCSNGKIELKPEAVAASILSLYKGAMERFLVSLTPRPKVVTWFNDAAEVARLPWVDLAMFLRRVGLDAHELASPVDFGAILKNTPMIARNVGIDGSSEHQLLDAWIMKARLHARILTAILDQLQDSKDPVERLLHLSPTQRSSLRQEVESALTSLVLACARSDPTTRRPSLFDYDGRDRYAPQEDGAELITRIIQAFNRFSMKDGSCVEAFSHWIHVEDDLANLLAILGGAIPTQVRERAAARLETIDVDKHLKGMSISAVKRIVETAALVERGDISEKALAYGDERMVHAGIHLRALGDEDWDVFAYRMRLLLAYRQTKDLEGLQRPPSADQHKIKIDGMTIDPCEDSKAFYKALQLLKNGNPEDMQRARVLFDDLVQRSPDAAINRFSAALHYAQSIPDRDQRILGFLDGMTEWAAAEATLSSTILIKSSLTIAYLKLWAYDGAERDDDFDLSWVGLTPEQRIHKTFILRALGNARRRGLSEREAKLLSSARDYYTGTEWDEIEKSDRGGDLLSKVATVSTVEAEESPRCSVLSAPDPDHAEKRGNSSGAQKLTGDVQRELYEALVDAFRSVEDMKQLVRFGINDNLEVLAGGGNLGAIVFNLIEQTESRGWTKRLIAAALALRPWNPNLRAFADRWGFATLEVTAKFDPNEGIP